MVLSIIFCKSYPNLDFFLKKHPIRIVYFTISYGLTYETNEKRTKPDHRMTNREQLLAKFYRGDCTREEIELLLIELQADQQEDYSEIMAQLWEQLKDFPELDDPTASRIMEKTLGKISAAEPGSEHSDQDQKNWGRGYFFRRLSVAAVLLSVIAVAFWMWSSYPPAVEIHTAYGEQRTLNLPDGSEVKLNANSSISFHENWEEGETRQVWLEGEAYFQVRKDSLRGRKFEVITRDLTVEVLGTVFNVNTRAEATMVFLEEGKINVNLEEAEEDILMDPGELVTYSVKTHQPVKRKAIQETPTSWKDGTVLLEGVSLQAILEKMEEIYGIAAKVENQTLLNRTFNFPMPVDNLDTAFLLLKESTGLVIERNDDELIIE